MSMLHILGVASFIFVVAFTARAYSIDTGHGQTPRGAIIEAWMNILVGFSINFVANFLILPLAGCSIGPVDNFLMGWIYTTVSIMRQYVIRRWFNARLHRAAMRLAGEKA